MRLTGTLTDGVDVTGGGRRRAGVTNDAVARRRRAPEAGGVERRQRRQLRAKRAPQTTRQRGLSEAGKAESRRKAYLDTSEPTKAFDLANTLVSAKAELQGGARARERRLERRRTTCGQFVAACDKDSGSVTAPLRRRQNRPRQRGQPGHRGGTAGQGQFPSHRLADVPGSGPPSSMQQQDEGRAEQMLRTPESLSVGRHAKRALFRAALSGCRRATG